jgi:hypothetical protein
MTALGYRSFDVDHWFHSSTTRKLADEYIEVLFNRHGGPNARFRPTVRLVELYHN